MILLLVVHQLRVGELAAELFITVFDLFQAIQHDKVPFRAPGARSTFEVRGKTRGRHSAAGAARKERAGQEPYWRRDEPFPLFYQV
jgi:hypothetical protein